jgi:hypothetical protein
MQKYLKGLASIRLNGIPARADYFGTANRIRGIQIEKLGLPVHSPDFSRHFFGICRRRPAIQMHTRYVEPVARKLNAAGRSKAA